MKMTDQQVLKAAAKQAQSQPQGEIKDANKAKLAERHNEIMNDPVAKQCLTDPTLKSVSVAGAVATTAAVAPEIANISTQIAKEKGIPILYKGAQIALENPPHAAARLHPHAAARLHRVASKLASKTITERIL